MPLAANVRKLTYCLFVLTIISLLDGCSGTATEKQGYNSDAPYRGNFERTGVFESGELHTTFSFKWKSNVAQTIFSAPISVNNLVYIGSGDRHLYALATGTGDEKWKFEAKGSIASSPTVDHGEVFIGSLDGSVYALDAESGMQRWSFLTKKGTEPPRIPSLGDTGVMSSPIVNDGVVYFGSIGGRIYALSEENGKELWEFNAENQIASSQALSQNKVLFTTSDEIYALNAKTGEKEWVEKIGDDGVFLGTPAVADGTVFLNDGQNIIALDVNTGNRKWDAKIGKQEILDNSVAVKNGMVIFCDMDGCQAVDEQTGHNKWHYGPGKNKGAATLPTIVGDEILYIDTDDDIVVIDLNSGSFKEKFNLQNGTALMPTSIAVANGAIYLGMQGGSDASLFAIQSGSST